MGSDFSRSLLKPKTPQIQGKGAQSSPKIKVEQEELRKFHPVSTTSPISSNKKQQSTAGGKAKAWRRDLPLCGGDIQELLKEQEHRKTHQHHRPHSKHKNNISLPWKKLKSGDCSNNKIQTQLNYWLAQSPMLNRRRSEPISRSTIVNTIYTVPLQ